MALTTRENLRLMADDQPQYYQDRATGDGAGSVFFLSHFPTYPNSGTAGTVAVNGTVYGTASYTLSWQHGRVAFGTAPLNAGTVQIDYLAASFTDDEVDEVWNYAGGSTNLFAAAAELWRLKAGKHAAHYSFGDANQKLSRSDWHKHCKEQVDLYEGRAKGKTATGGVWVSGVSVAAKDSVVEDSDRVPNRFRKDQFRNPGSTNSIEDLDADD